VVVVVAAMMSLKNKVKRMKQILMERGGDQLGIEQMEVEPYEPITQAIKIAIAAFSLLLLALSIAAYRKTAFKRILYAAVAFGLFAIQMFFDYLEDAIEAFDTPYTDMIFFWDNSGYSGIILHGHC